MAWTSFAPAKLNLTLHVGQPAEDGYHPVHSLVAFTTKVGDRVSAYAHDALRLSLEGPFAAALARDQDNLVLRAARLLAKEGGVPAGASLVLDKQLPIASGIGGGSADAAATLRVLNALWGLNASHADLAFLAARLGADVPACVESAPAVLSGRGEICTPIALATFFVVLVNPLAPASTLAVYRAYDAAGRFGVADGGEPPPPDPLAQFVWLCASAQRNDLTDAAIAICPEIADVVEALNAYNPGGLVRLSGSGSTVFAVHTDEAAAADHAAVIAARHPLWWVATSPIGAAEIGVRPLSV